MRLFRPKSSEEEEKKEPSLIKLKSETEWTMPDVELSNSLFDLLNTVTLFSAV